MYNAVYWKKNTHNLKVKKNGNCIIGNRFNKGKQYWMKERNKSHWFKDKDSFHNQMNRPWPPMISGLFEGSLS